MRSEFDDMHVGFNDNAIHIYRHICSLQDLSRYSLKCLLFIVYMTADISLGLSKKSRLCSISVNSLEEKKRKTSISLAM